MPTPTQTEAASWSIELHAADDTPSKNAGTRDTHCYFIMIRQVWGCLRGSSRIEEERDETSRGRHNKGMSRGMLQATPPMHDQTQNMP